MPLERDWRRRDAEFGLAVEIEIIVAAGGEIEALLTAPGIIGAQLRRNRPDRVADRGIRFEEVGIEAARAAGIVIIKHPDIDAETVRQRLGRSDERRVGKACVSTCRSRWSPSP